MTTCFCQTWATVLLLLAATAVLLLPATLTTTLCVEALVQPTNDAAMSSRRTALVTGSTDGIGVTTAKHLARHGWTVLIHGRDKQRIAEAVRQVEAFCTDHQKPSSGAGRVVPLPPADLSTVDGCRRLVASVRATCQKHNLPPLSVLMNNAGVYQERLERTEYLGLETTFAVNVLAPFVVTSLLLPDLLASSSSSSSLSNCNDMASIEDNSSSALASRIVIASSISQCWDIRDWGDVHLYERRRYSAHGAYSESKLLDAMLTLEMADRLQTAGLPTHQITCNCLDPGTVNTKMLLAGWGRIGMHVKDALDQTWLCTSSEVEGVSGQYFVSQCKRRASVSAYDLEERAKLWKLLTDLAPEAAAAWDNALLLASQSSVH